jgi:hypothetical protein
MKVGGPVPLRTLDRREVERPLAQGVVSRK